MPINRRLLLLVEGRPKMWAVFASEVRTRILTYSDDYADTFEIFSVSGPDSLDPEEDITERFAIEWSQEFEFADGFSASDAMGPFPAFVREAAGSHLLQAWTDARAAERQTA